ncbi:EpsG family protein [Solemya velum gill symbiont]|uniref:EpsG family protein n=1 Tax=Solemya velum gill symbiont TaxID=2340 RepID=UPI0009985983|nr:EpsG family protein [Solemya velum gill symbiont]OOY60185.1 hypothetical protein BOW02_06680 [Solemya velum gill symbiont]OOY73649.1 hypothetical protein BOW09_10435 [Solemya velum gill symbiont]OOY76517.1 hypothetical protein BOW10_09410 [Solemya velum gill symbiont]OOY81500.1 hypothetical protein BOW12_09780 [Solemya velum gill symbiont]OOY84981.1 hypothetical protein BOW13_06390 [Solemya velum gill symbiont]
MLAYWFMYLLPGFMAIALSHRHRIQSFRSMGWFWLIFVLFIGLRFEVGGDWGNYLRYYEMAYGEPLASLLSGRGDPGYVFLNWIAANNDWGMGFVNLVCAVIFMTGLISFSSKQPAPWLALTVAVPYLVIVVSMGYTRQGVALGLIFLALNWLEKRNLFWFLFYIVVAALFHKSAMLMVPLGFFITRGNWLFRGFVVISIAYGLWGLIVSDSYEAIWANYVDAEMKSQGALIRIVMNLAPALVLLLFRRQWLRVFPDGRFWIWMAFGAVAAVFLVSFASTAVDRVSLYLTPLQVVVLSRMPYLFRNRVTPQATTTVLVLGYAAVLFVRLNYATHAPHWLPYRNLLFQ